MRRTRKVVILLSLLSAAMLLFSYALVPLYNVMCKELGLNGKPNLQPNHNTDVVDRSRSIRVQFVATNNAELPWDFQPNVRQIEIHPGEKAKLSFYARNNTNKTMTVQAVPSITPGLAAAHLKKTECFCFTQQTLHAHQAKNMPLIFHLDNTLPKDIHEITLSYTLFLSHTTRDAR